MRARQVVSVGAGRSNPGVVDAHQLAGRVVLHRLALAAGDLEQLARVVVAVAVGGLAQVGAPLHLAEVVVAPGDVVAVGVHLQDPVVARVVGCDGGQPLGRGAAFGAQLRGTDKVAAQVVGVLDGLVVAVGLAQLAAGIGPVLP